MIKEFADKKGSLKGFVGIKTLNKRFDLFKEKAIKESKSYNEVLKEQMVQGDFVTMANVLDRELQNMYKVPEGTNFDLLQLCKKRLTGDFRDVETYQLDEIADLEEVLEKEDYHEEEVNDSLLLHYKLRKWGRLFTCSWEATLADTLGEIKLIPQKLIRAANRRRQTQIHNAFVANAAFFNVANVNIGTGVMNEANVEAGIRAVMAQTDLNGNPINTAPVFLVHPTALTHMAQRICQRFNGIVVAITKGTAPLTLNLTPICDPRLDAVSITGWYLFCDPNELAPIEFLQLRGHENPELFIKDSDAKLLSEFGIAGTDTSPYDGDFYNDDIEFKGRDIHNVIMVDFRAGYYSDGTV